MGCGASKELRASAGQEEELVARTAEATKPVPWDGRPIDPGNEVLLLRGVAVKRFAFSELGLKTSHDLLRLLGKQYTDDGGKEVEDEKGNKVWAFGPAQVEIMEKLGMFKRSDFVVVAFEKLESFPYSVWSYTWNDSKWRELVLALQKLLPGMFEEGEEEEFFWLDIFCLDQFKADKMKSIFRSDEIYGWAVKYYVMGLAIFDRVWCLAETTCTGEKAQRRKDMIMVTDFDGFLGRREGAYKLAKLKSDPTFNGSRCTVESDREIVKTRILESGFASIDAFDAYVKEVADKTLQPFRQDEWKYDRGPDGKCKICGCNEGDHYHHSNGNKFCRVGALIDFAYRFEASETDENKCRKCDKLKEHHHTKNRDGTISGWEFCYDFLLD